jgi:hypothetical protein
VLNFDSQKVLKYYFPKTVSSSEEMNEKFDDSWGNVSQALVLV